MVGGIWFCQRCIDAMADHDAQPVVSTDNPDNLDALQRWLDGLRDRQQRPGKEPNQEPVQLTPIPPYEYPLVPGGRPTSGTPPPVQLVRDPESMTVPEQPREYAPVSASPHSPTRMKTRPFMPSSREPVQSAPVIVNHPRHAKQPVPPPYEARHENGFVPPTISTPPNTTNSDPVNQFVQFVLKTIRTIRNSHQTIRIIRFCQRIQHRKTN